MFKFWYCNFVWHVANRCCFIRPHVSPTPPSDHIISTQAELEHSFVLKCVVLIN